MEMQSKRNKALSVVTAATLAASLGVPAVAVADEVDQAVVVQESGGARSEEAADAGVVAAREANVAQVGDKRYETLSQAIAEAPSGSVITMIADATASDRGESVRAKALTLDLNGNRIDAIGSAFAIYDGGALTLRDSSKGQSGVVSADARGTSAITVGNGSFVMEGGTIESGVCLRVGVIHNGAAEEEFQVGRSVVDIKGGVIDAEYTAIGVDGFKERSGVSVSLSGGLVSGGGHGIWTSAASYPSQNQNGVARPHGGVKVSISGGTLRAGAGDNTHGVALCLDGVNDVAEVTGGTIEGDTGIEVAAGELLVSGDAAIAGTGRFLESSHTDHGDYGPNRISGCGIAVAQEVTKERINVQISGAPSISGVYGLREWNLENNAPEDIAKVAVRIDGGTFMSKGSEYGGAALEIADCKGVVTGGRYNTVPSSDLIAEGYVVQAAEDGMVEVVSASPAPGPGPAPEPAPDPEPEVDVDVEQRPDGSTVTTETAPDGSQTVTTESADGTASVVSKDADGNITSAEVAVSDEAVEAGRVVLPLEPAKPAVDADKAPAVEVKMPTAAAGAASVKVTVPVAASDDGAPNHGVVVYAVDAEGNEVLLPKCGVDAEGNAVFEAEGDVTIKVVDASPSFPDVEGAWYGSDGTAAFVGARGILTGVPQGDGALLFDGGAPTTRAMFVTMLHRVESKPLAPEAGFEDVDGEWFAAAAAWGEATGVVNGYGDGSVFGGNDPVTREQMAVFAMRYAQHLGLDTSARADLSGFADGAQASGYASEALSWAVAEGVIKGHADGSGRLDPRGGATRAETAAVVMRFINGMYE